MKELRKLKYLKAFIIGTIIPSIIILSGVLAPRVYNEEKLDLNSQKTYLGLILYYGLFNVVYVYVAGKIDNLFFNILITTFVSLYFTYLI